MGLHPLMQCDVLCITPTSMEQFSQARARLTASFVQRMEMRVDVPIFLFRLLRFGPLVSRPPHACTAWPVFRLLQFRWHGGHRAKG